MPQSDLFTPSTLSVSELTGEIKEILEGHFPDVRVEGEVSNVSRSRSGHVYFTLKDEDAQLSCVIWSSTRRRKEIELEDGQQIVAGGEIQVYPPHGKYQLIVRTVEQAGKGALQEAFEKLKARLKEEGLFEDEHKKKLPKFPKRIGVITSATGAAFHDIRDTVARRWPLSVLVLHHASVQGVKAAPELVRAVEYFSREQNVDVLIIGRGGGSLEDLWPFNEEAVARAIFDCPLPVISAVGHETDFSISDFVADARAATPTQAGSLATPDINEYRLYVDDLATRVAEGVPETIAEQRRRVEQLLKSHALGAIRQKVVNTRDRIDSYAGRLEHVGKRMLAGRRDRLQRLSEQLRHRQELLLSGRRERLIGLHHRLEKLDFNAPLERGFARVHQEGRWVREGEAFETGKAFELEWKDRQVEIGG